MTTSWKAICAKIKMNGLAGTSRTRGGSDASVASSTNSSDTVATNSSTPLFTNNNRSSFDNEWQMNYMVVNRRDGLPKVKRDKKSEDKKLGSSSAKDAKTKVAPRIDTNIVKLKLLEASRKAIMNNLKRQFLSSATQTDAIKTKLFKDQQIGNQRDLIKPSDKSTETGVDFIGVRAAKDGTLTVTSTCAVNTEKIQTECIATQTFMPRSNVAFDTFLGSYPTFKDTQQDEPSDENETDESSRELMKIEKRLKSKKKLSRHRLTGKPAVEIPVKDDGSDDATVKEDLKGSDSEFEDSIQEDQQPDVIKGSASRPKQTEATFNSWHDLEINDDTAKTSKSYASDVPWTNFKDLVLGQKFLNARMSPKPQRRQYINFEQATWADSQLKVVTDLMREANALIDMFDQVAMLLGPDIKLHEVSEDVEDFQLPPSKYKEEMAKSCDKLQATLKRLEEFPTFKKINV